MKVKKFDCVEMMHKGARKVRERVRGLTTEQEAAFWRELVRAQKSKTDGQSSS
jgi:hypothetical protein